MINRHIAYFALRCKGSLIRQHKGFFDVIVFILHGRKTNFSILFSALIYDFSNLFQGKINDFSKNIAAYFMTFQFILNSQLRVLHSFFCVLQSFLRFDF